MKNFFALLGVLITGASIGQPLTFYRESMNFELDSTTFYVSGMYFIRNLTDKAVTTRIFYPYVYETSEINGISVYNCNTMTFLETYPGKKVHWFTLTVPPSDSVVVNIKYHHNHNGNQVTYILTTTRFWNRPFQMADYTLRIREGLNAKKMFMPADTLWNENGFNYYYWKRYNYMPETDFTIEFVK